MVQSHDGVGDFFTRGPGSGTSAHYVVSQPVGSRRSVMTMTLHIMPVIGQINLRSIGIECRPEASEEDVRTVAELGSSETCPSVCIPIITTACPGPVICH